MVLLKFCGLFLFLISQIIMAQSCESCLERRARLLRSPPENFNLLPTAPTGPAFTPQTSGSSLAVILFPIHVPDYPSDIVTIKENILRFVQEHKLDTSNLVSDQFHGTSTPDIMISALTKLRMVVAENCPVRTNINMLLLYLIEAKYLKQRQYTTIVPSEQPIIQQFFIVQPSDLSDPSNPASNVNINVQNTNAILIQILEKLNALSIGCNRCQREIQLADFNALTPRRPTIIPTTPPTTTTPVPTTTTPKPIPPYAFLIAKLPQPQTELEQTYFVAMSLFLSRLDLGLLLGKYIGDINQYKSDHDLLKALLSRSLALKLAAQEISAIKYYLEYEVKLAALSLFTRKEIHKQFDLSGIILRTINLQMLTDEQRVAFDIFFQFVLNIGPEQMSGFDTWTEAKTKGEFMRILFDYFVKSSFVSDEIKKAIMVLIPTIKMDQEGAEPV